MTDLDASFLLSADRTLPPPAELLALAAKLVEAGQPDLAATACDAAMALAPEDPDVLKVRALLLDRLRIEEHGLVFRYVPAGPFLMGSSDGDADERPVHAVELGPFWITDTPITWTAYHAIMGFPPPPTGLPPEKPAVDKNTRKVDVDRLWYYNANRIRARYCQSERARALMSLIEELNDAQSPDEEKIAKATELAQGMPPVDPERPWFYDEKPMVAILWEIAVALGDKISDDQVNYGLPTEAQWEKAARGGLVGRRYAWGDAPPTPELCDFDRFEDFSIREPRSFPPNGYGLFGVSGGVREWTRDGYDAAYYAESPRADPSGPATIKQRVLRGGSWADCASAVRVSFRMGRSLGTGLDPTIGFRLCRTSRVKLPGGESVGPR